MKRWLRIGMIGAALGIGASESAAQSRPSGYYTQRIGSGAMMPNGRIPVGSTYGIGYGVGLGRGIAAPGFVVGAPGIAYGSTYAARVPRSPNVTWYSVASGYSSGPQTGVPWRNGSPRSEWGSPVPLDGSPDVMLARSRTVSGRDYSLASKLARARLAAEAAGESTAVPVSSRSVEKVERDSKGESVEKR